VLYLRCGQVEVKDFHTKQMTVHNKLKDSWYHMFLLMQRNITEIWSAVQDHTALLPKTKEEVNVFAHV